MPLVVAAALGAALGVGVAAAIHVPRVDAVAAFSPKLITQLRDQRGVVFATYARERRMLIQEGDLPAVLQNAVVAAEDSEFFRHGGIDAVGIVRSVLVNLQRGRHAQGASTITMQLARELFLTREKTWKRKIEEAFLAVELEKTLSKQQILTLYCNLAFLGHGNYGMEAAARDYFGHGVGELTLPEAAALAGIVQRPSEYSPLRNPAKVVARRDYVLRRMREEGYLDETAYRAALATPLVVERPRTQAQTALYFAEEVRQQIEERFGTEQLYQEGLQIDTTLDGTVQQGAEEALRAGLLRLDHRKGWRGPIARGATLLATGGDIEELAGRNPVPDRWVPGLVLEASAAAARVRLPDREIRVGAEGIAWTGRRTPAEVLRQGDVAWFRLEPETKPGKEPFWVVEQEPVMEGTVIVLESASGAVRGLVGGWDFHRNKFDRAMQARRQVGSAFKPFVYGAALENGFTPADTLFDAPAVFLGADALPTYSPRNYYRRYYGILTLRRALELSVNVTSVKLMDLIGVGKVVDLAQRCGVRSDLPPYPSLALGSADLLPIEVAGAYAAVANQGVYVRPYLVEQVRDRTGAARYRHQMEASRAMDPAVAYVLTAMLEGVVDRGTAGSIADLPLAIAGKTGTTNDYTDAWFVGFTPRHTILAWVGYDQKRTLGKKMTGAEAALPIWRQGRRSRAARRLAARGRGLRGAGGSRDPPDRVLGAASPPAPAPSGSSRRPSSPAPAPIASGRRSGGGSRTCPGVSSAPSTPLAPARRCRTPRPPGRWRRLPPRRLPRRRKIPRETDRRRSSGQAGPDADQRVVLVPEEQVVQTVPQLVDAVSQGAKVVRQPVELDFRQPLLDRERSQVDTLDRIEAGELEGEAQALRMDGPSMGRVEPEVARGDQHRERIGCLQQEHAARLERAPGEPDQPVQALGGQVLDHVEGHHGAERLLRRPAEHLEQIADLGRQPLLTALLHHRSAEVDATRRHAAGGEQRERLAAAATEVEHFAAPLEHRQVARDAFGDLGFGAAEAALELEVDMLLLGLDQRRNTARLGLRKRRAEAAPDDAGFAAQVVELLVDAREERVVVPHHLGQAVAPDRLEVVQAVFVDVVHRRRRSSPRWRYSRRIRLKTRCRSQRSFWGACTNGRSRRLIATTRPPRKPRWLRTGNRRSPSHSHRQSDSSRVGSPRKRSIAGEASLRGSGAPGSPDVKALPCGFDRQRQVGDDVRMEIDPHGVVADGLDAAGEIDLPAVDLDALGRQRLHDLGGRHRAVEGAGFHRAPLQHEAQPADPCRDLRRRVALGGVAGVDLLALLLEHLQVAGRRFHRDALRKEEIAGVARLDLDDLSPPTAVAQVAHQDHLHRGLRLSRW